MVDIDNLLKYASPKYVYIRNAKLGIMKYLFMLLIFFYVVCYEIFYSCTHLVPHHAAGFGEIALQHPTKKCDPLDETCRAHWASIADKKYCKQNHPSKDDTSVERKLGDSKDEPEKEKKEKKAEPEKEKKEKKEDDKKKKDKDSKDVGDIITEPQTCRYFDGFRATWSPPQPSEIFIPTRYEQIKQEISPECYDPEIHGVKGAEGGRSQYECSRPWVTKETNEFFIANIEDFDLLLQHTFEQPTIGLAGASTDYQGFFAACKSNHPASVAECKRMKIPESAGDVAPEDVADLTSAEDLGINSLKGTPQGDRIRFGDLLKVSPVAQNYGLEDKEILDVQLPDYFDHPGQSLREAGGMVLLDVNYDNFAYMRSGITFGGLIPSFDIKPVTYSYRAYFLPMKHNIKMQLLEDSDFPQKRTVDRWYGVTVRMQFNGKLVRYSLEDVLTGLSTGLVLLSSATTIVMYVAAYLLPLKEKYCLLMYQLSEDFTDYITLKRNRKGKDKKDNVVQSSYATGKKLLDKIDGGTESGKLTDEELNRILCVNEMRLNRLDGMDPKCVFEAGDEDDPMNLAIGDAAREFYVNNIGETPEIGKKIVSEQMSFRVQEQSKRAEIIDSRKLKPQE